MKDGTAMVYANPAAGTAREKLSMVGGLATFATAAENTVQLQRVIDAAPANTTLVCPPGQFLLNRINITKALTLAGQGFGATFFVPSSDDDCIAVAVGASSKVFNVELRDFAVFPTSNRAAGAAIHLGNVGSCRMTAVKIGNSLGGRPYEGLRCDAATDCAFDFLRVSGCTSHNVVVEAAGAGQVCVELVFSSSCAFNSSLTGSGMLLRNGYGGGASVEGIHLSPGCSFYGNALDGLTVECNTGATMQTVHCEGAIFDTNGRDGLRITGTATAGSIKHVILQNLWASSNTEKGVNVSAVVKDMDILGGLAVLNGQNGIYANGVQRLTVANVEAYDNSQSATQTYYGMEYLSCDNLNVKGGGAFNTGNKTNKSHGIHYDACTDTREVGLNLNVLSGQTAYSLTNVTAGEVQRSLWSESDSDSFLRSIGAYVISGTTANEQIQWVSSADQTNKVIHRINGTVWERLNAAGAAVINRWDNLGNFQFIGSGTADPTATDIPASYCRLWKRTDTGTVSLWYNDAGTLKKVALT